MLNLVKAISLALAGLGMASAHSADAKFDAFMQTVSGNKTTVTFGSGGTPVLTSSAPLGTPSISAMGFERQGGDIYMRSNGAAKLSTGGTVPIETKLKLTRNALAKGLAKATLFYTAWETGSALFDIWDDFGLAVQNGQVGTPQSGGNFYVSTGYRLARTRSEMPEPYYYAPEPWCRALAAVLDSSPTYKTVYKSSTLTSVNAFRCVLDTYVRSNNSLLGSDTYTEYPTANPSCPSGYFVLSGGACQQNQPVSFQAETPETIEAIVADLLASEGWPSTGPAAAARDALVIPQVQTEVLPLIEAQPQADTQVQVRGIPQGTPIAIGDPVTTTTTTTNPDGSTTTQTKTTTTTATATGNQIQTEQQTQVQTVTRDAQGNVTGTTTATTTAPALPVEPQPVDLEVCGLPDTPACKIDEEGTPETVPELEDPEAAAESVFRPLLDLVNDPESFWPSLPSLNWSFQMPTGCGIISVPAFSPFLDEVDVCQFQPMFHEIMSIVWIIGGLFGAIGMFWRNVMATQ